MLSRAASRLLQTTGFRAFTASARSLEGELEKSKDEFMAKLRPFLSAGASEPNFPTDFLPDTKIGPTDGPTPTKVKLNFAMPHKIIMTNEEVRPGRVSVAAMDVQMRCVSLGARGWRT